jgi:CBS domain-containing protein
MRLLDLIQPEGLTISVNDYAIEAQRLMAEQQTSWIIVLEGLQMVGVVFERDLRGLPPALLNERDVREYVSAYPLTVDSGVSIQEASRLLNRSGLDFLTVLRDNQPIGIVTRENLSQHRSHQRQAG